MSGINLGITQVQKQVQVQTMSQRQIQSLEILSLGSDELRERIFREADKNPALEILSDPLESDPTARGEDKPRSNALDRYASVTAAGTEASDNFQAIIEAAPDEKESLQDHLLSELSMINFDDNGETFEICSLIVGNLDSHGHHILAPESLSPDFLDEKKREKLYKCLGIVQNLDPVGCAVKNVWESLLVQARANGCSNDALIFLLDGHADMLNPPKADKILKKISLYREGILSLFGLPPSEMEKLERTKSYTEADITEALSFMKTLDPNPASAFSSSPAVYIQPDVRVEKAVDDDKNEFFKISLCRGNLPEAAITSDLKDDSKFAKDAIREARAFLNEIAFRESTLLSAVGEIVKVQGEFFKKGPRYLAPLRQKDVAKAVGVHETTISRMATRKYLQCEWGLFEIGYFFTNQAGSSEGTSQEGAKREIEEILKAHKDDKKPLSDQKIADILSERGIKIARRTVAKYRAALNISSSYDR